MFMNHPSYRKTFTSFVLPCKPHSVETQQTVLNSERFQKPHPRSPSSYSDTTCEFISSQLTGIINHKVLEWTSAFHWHRVSANLNQPPQKHLGREKEKVVPSTPQVVLWTCFTSDPVDAKMGGCCWGLATWDKGHMRKGHLSPYWTPEGPQLFRSSLLFNVLV